METARQGLHLQRAEKAFFYMLFFAVCAREEILIPVLWGIERLRSEKEVDTVYERRDFQIFDENFFDILNYQRRFVSGVMKVGK